MATENLSLAENAVTDTVKECLVDNFNANMEKIDEAFGGLECETFSVLKSNVSIEPTTITGWRIGNTAFVTGYISVGSALSEGTKVAESAAGVRPQGYGGQEIQFPAASGASGTSACGILSRTDTGFEILLMASDPGCYRFSAMFPCTVA